MDYPIIKSPFNESDYIDEVEEFVLEPVEPKKPVEPVFDQKQSKGSGCTGMVIGAALIMILGTLITGDPEFNESVVIILICLAAIIVSIIIIVSQSRTEQERIEVYNKSFKEYQTELAHYKSIYFEYLDNRTFYRDEIERLKEPEYRRNFLNSKFREFISQTSIPIENPDKYKKGITEEYFMNHLHRHFNKRIFANFSIQRSYKLGLRLTEQNLYMPDFVYYDEDTGMCIDIEIDEPYIGSSGVPIHYINCGDDIRDDFFLNHNWFVIRFTEKQIIEQPISCCYIIAELIDQYIPESHLTENIDTSSALIPEQQWSDEEAKELALIRYRNSYLPEEMQLNIKEEYSERSLDDFIQKPTDVDINDFEGPDDLPF